LVGGTGPTLRFCMNAFIRVSLYFEESFLASSPSAYEYSENGCDYTKWDDVRLAAAGNHSLVGPVPPTNREGMDIPRNNEHYNQPKHFVIKHTV
jgi:hypothetical protein